MSDKHWWILLILLVTAMPVLQPVLAGYGPAIRHSVLVAEELADRPVPSTAQIAEVVTEGVSDGDQEAALAAIGAAARTVLTRVRPAVAGPWLETANGSRLFVYGINYEGPADQAWQMWRNDRFDRTRIAEDFRRIQAGGFNTARIFVQAPLVADLAAGRFEKLDYLLDQADLHGIRVIVTLADDNENRVEILTSRARQLGRRYAGRGTILAYDLKNEPQFATFGTAVYPRGQPVPLFDRALISRYGERRSLDEARRWRTSVDGQALTPERFNDEELYLWSNIVVYYRELLGAAGTWAEAVNGRTIADYLDAPEAAAWRPLVAALSDTVVIWSAPQIEAIRDADPAALVTIGYNNLLLAALPAGHRLQIQSFHRFPAFGVTSLRSTIKALEAIQRRFPTSPVLLEEFGYSNQTRSGEAIDADTTAAHEMALWLELARHNLAGGLKWMLYDFDQGANPYENAFGALRANGAPKPVYLLGQSLAPLLPWRVTSLELEPIGAEVGMVARGPNWLVLAGPQVESDVGVVTSADGLVVVSWRLLASQLRLTSLQPATIRLATRRLLNLPPERLRLEREGASGVSSRVEGEWLVMTVPAGASLVLKTNQARPFARVAPLAGSPAQTRYFAETGHNLSSGFKTFWERQGGLAVFGLPVTEEFREITPHDGNEYTVQYFERARFEYHPEHKGTPFEVELGLLGRHVTEERREEWAFLRQPAFPDTAERRYFRETGHTLSYGFKSFWDRHGGLAVFGLPISEEFREVNPADGKEYTVQYFERARFEYHPEHKGTAYEVELGLLGAQIIGAFD